MKSTIAFTLLALTFLSFAKAGEEKPGGCPSGQTHTSGTDVTCIDCSAAAHGANCAHCSAHEAKCLLCNAGFFNPSTIGGVCTENAPDNTGLENTKPLPNCVYPRRDYDEKKVGCQRCADGFMLVKNEATKRIECTDCSSTVTACAACGGKDVTNCEGCHSIFGCGHCSKKFIFNMDDTFTKVNDMHYGVCKSCQHGWTGDKCDKCKEGYHNVDGHCIEVNEAMCGGKIIPGCQKCGTENPNLCAQCATGYGKDSTLPEFERCMICQQGCADCIPENMFFRKCIKCVHNKEHPTNEKWCFPKEMGGLGGLGMNANILSIVTLTVLALFFR